MLDGQDNCFEVSWRKILDFRCLRILSSREYFLTSSIALENKLTFQIAYISHMTLSACFRNDPLSQMRKLVNTNHWIIE